MDKLFLTILNMSLTGSAVIVIICVARLFLKKAPKIISYLFWIIAAFRLVFPFAMESFFSLIPFKPQPIPTDIALQPIPRVDSGMVIVDNIVNNTLPAPLLGDSVNPLQVWIEIGTYAWLIGVVLFVVYAIVSYVLLKMRMRHAAYIKENIYESENVKSPFVLGFVSPKIYLPTDMSEKEIMFITSHERTHIKRCDHIIKFAAYLVLCLHWFNPLVWVAFCLMGKDMEMSCDERVLKELGTEIKSDYSRTLLSFAAERHIISGSPLSFGENGVKARIKNILNFKKPAFWVVAIAAISCAAVGLGLSLNPQTKLSLTSLDGLIQGDKLNMISSVLINTPRGEVLITDRQEIDNVAKFIKELEIYKTEIRQDRSVDRDSTNRITLRQMISGSEYESCVNFSNDFSEGWFDNKIKPTFSYRIVDIDKTRNFIDGVFGPAEPAQHEGGGTSDYYIMTKEIGAIGYEYGINKNK